MAIVKKISELTPKGSNLGNTDLLIVGVDNGTDYDLKSVTGAQLLGTVVSQTITDGVTTKAPSENVVYDNLALKVDKVAGKGLSTEDYTTVEKSKLAGLSGTNTGDQTLQEVTDKGNTTTNDIYVNGTNVQAEILPDLIRSSNDFNKSASLTSDGRLLLNTNGTNTCDLRALNTTGDVVLDFPNKATGFYTIATTTDLTSKVDGNTAITGTTKTKITYDSKGLVTSGADATTADIADSLNKRYVTDANLTVIGNTSGTNTGDQDLSTYQPYTTATTGAVISFIVPQVYNSVASPSSSNITDSLTSAKIGLVQKIYHNHTVAPTFPAGWVKMGTATYTTSTLNVIFAEWVSSTRVEYWITKPS
jgi:hypothetical protein